MQHFFIIHTTQSNRKSLHFFSFQLSLCCDYNRIKLSFRNISTFFLAPWNSIINRWIRQLEKKFEIQIVHCEWQKRKCKWHNYWMHAKCRQSPPFYEVLRDRMTFFCMNVGSHRCYLVLAAQNRNNNKRNQTDKRSFYNSCNEPNEGSGVGGRVCGEHQLIWVRWCRFICSDATGAQCHPMCEISSEIWLKMCCHRIKIICMLPALVSHFYRRRILSFFWSRTTCSPHYALENAMRIFITLAFIWTVVVFFSCVRHFCVSLELHWVWLPNGATVLVSCLPYSPIFR